MSFTSWLKSQKAGHLPFNPKKFQAVRQGQSPVGLTMYPPLNSDTRLRQFGHYDPNVKRFRASKGLTLPENFNNLGGGDPDPTPERRQRYANVCRPMNQYFCGSCYACSVANMMSDIFTYAQGTNPNVSPLALITCQQGSEGADGCGGGNPSLVVDEIAKHGLTTSFCLDYTTQCKGIPLCSQTPGGDDSTRSLNAQLMPSTCGCCNPSKTHYKYFIKNKALLHATSALNQSYNKPDAIQEIKEHLWNFGTAVGCFLVPANWMNDVDHGKFTATRGVYVESENYSGNPHDIPDDSFSNSMGGHAICIVGWGVEKGVTLSSGVTLDLPYWVARNSWGTDWGLSVPDYQGNMVGGYFKYAMYQPARPGFPEINPNTAFERENQLQGGLLVFEPDKIVEYTDPTQVSCIDPNFKLYQQNETFGGAGLGSDGKVIFNADPQVTPPSMWSVVLVMVLIILILGLMFALQVASFFPSWTSVFPNQVGPYPAQNSLFSVRI